MRDVLFTAFLWGFGAYRFDPDDGPASHEEINLEISTPSLLLEVVSCLDSPETLRQGLGDLDQPVAVAPKTLENLMTAQANLSPGDAYVLSRADGYMTMRQIVATSPLPAMVVEKSLLGLLCAGALDCLPRVVQAGERGAAERRLEIETFLAGLRGKGHFEVLGLRVHQAESELREILDEDQDCIEACMLLGGLYRDRGLHRRAATAFGRVLELRPAHPQATAELRTLPLGDNGSMRAGARR